MKKKLLVLLATLVLIICSVSFIGCGAEPSLSGVYQYKDGNEAYTLYLYEEGEGYLLVTDGDEIEESYRFEYKILEENKYIALNEGNETTILEYEQLGRKHIYIYGLTFTKQ